MSDNVVELEQRRPKKRAKARKPKRAKAPEAWERQPGESTPAFEAFATYRDMGVERSTRAVARKVSKAGSLVMGWSAKHSWPRRVALYDAMLDRQRVDANIEAVERMSDRQARDLGTVADVLAEPARELARRFVKQPELVRGLSFEDLVKVTLATGRVYPGLVQAERLVRGLSTDRPDHDGRQVADAEVFDYLAGRDDGAGEVVARVGVVVNGNGTERPQLPPGES